MSSGGSTGGPGRPGRMAKGIGVHMDSEDPGDGPSRYGASRFVGRAEELGAIDASLRGLLRGETSAVFVTGDVGVGKTRLLAEAAERMRAAGAVVLEGVCVGPNLGNALLYPVRNALARRDDRAARELLRYIGELDGRGDRIGAVLDGVSTGLCRVAAGRPLALVIDNLQWVDATTGGLLLHLHAGLGGQPSCCWPRCGWTACRNSTGSPGRSPSCVASRRSRCSTCRRWRVRRPRTWRTRSRVGRCRPRSRIGCGIAAEETPSWSRRSRAGCATASTTSRRRSGRSSPSRSRRCRGTPSTWSRPSRRRPARSRTSCSPRCSTSATTASKRPSTPRFASASCAPTATATASRSSCSRRLRSRGCCPASGAGSTAATPRRFRRRPRPMRSSPRWPSTGGRRASRSRPGAVRWRRGSGPKPSTATPRPASAGRSRCACSTRRPTPTCPGPSDPPWCAPPPAPRTAAATPSRRWRCSTSSRRSPGGRCGGTSAGPAA
ncbi:ATP-binding protein [Dactylosporangium darangshiense]|uniref:ATP-binding protein n=1 Tax=Dactylosporangium darangshiense TaxID=579108 RepID=UPI003632CFD6